MKNVKSFLCALIFLILATACKNDSESPYTGSIIGFVNLASSSINIDDFSGVKVSIDNTNIFATTNSLGKFELKNVARGTYDITVSKQGFGTYRQFSISYAGGPAPGVIPIADIGNTPTILLGEIPSFTISNFDVTFANNSLNLSFNTSVPTSKVLLFANDGATVSTSQYKYLIYLNVENGVLSNQFELIPGNIKKLKVVAYPVSSAYGYGTYYRDRDTNTRIYTSVGTPTPVIEVSIP